MLRKLLIVFASGVILAIVAFASALLVGGQGLRDGFTKGDGWSFPMGENDKDEAGPRKTRELAYVSGSPIAFSIPVEVQYTRADKPRMTVEGPAAVVDRIVWKDGRMEIPGRVQMNRGLVVKIASPVLGALDLDAPGDVTLTGLDQQELALTANGAIDLDASGKVTRIKVESEGAGSIDLAKVRGQDATVRVDGAGDVTVGPSHLADVEINGVGTVSLVRKPQILRSQVNGIGSIDHDY